jgi:hypothetical protein
LIEALTCERFSKQNVALLRTFQQHALQKQRLGIKTHTFLPLASPVTPTLVREFDPVGVTSYPQTPGWYTMENSSPHFKLTDQ